jgi:hypothetical protein
MFKRYLFASPPGPGLFFAPGAHVRLTHQPGHPFAGGCATLIFQFTMNARTAISSLVREKYLSNLLRQLSIFPLALTGRTLAPGIKATFRDSEHVAHHHNGKFLLVLIDEPIFHLESREKMLTPFLLYLALAVLFPILVSVVDFLLLMLFNALSLETLLLRVVPVPCATHESHCRRCPARGQSVQSACLTFAPVVPLPL